MYVTDPAHGGKVTCHKCGGFIKDDNGMVFMNNQPIDEFPEAFFHSECYNRYEHYYGLDKPID